MAYQAEKNEYFFCGACRRIQLPENGEHCVICGKLTVSWHIDREDEDAALKRWKHVNG